MYNRLELAVDLESETPEDDESRSLWLARLRKGARSLAVVLACGAVVITLYVTSFHILAIHGGNLGEAVNLGIAPTNSTQCSFQSFPVPHTIKATAIAEDGPNAWYPVIATPEEMNFGIDMPGLWWMMGNKLAEEFVSWKGSTSNNPNQFPMVMSAPSNLMGHWVWPASVAGRFLMSWYAVTEEPDVPQIMQWTNSTYCVIVPVAGGGNADSGMQYVLRKNMTDPTGDVWIRENLEHPGDPTPEYVYTLVRVINGDGTPNSKWWPKFLEYADQLGMHDLMIWGNNNKCMRSCETYSWCSFCKWMCGVD